MIDQKEVGLIVRAQLKGRSDLKAITQSVKELQAALIEQGEAARKGEGRIDDLRATLTALQQAQDRLGSQAGLVGTFQKLEAQAAKTAERVERSGAAYASYAAQLDALGVPTEKQQDRLVKLSTSFERAQAAMAKQRGQLADVAKALNETGIATDNLAKAEQDIRDSAVQIGAALARTNDEIQNYSSNMRKAATAAKDEAKAVADAERIKAEARQAQLTQVRNAIQQGIELRRQEGVAAKQSAEAQAAAEKVRQRAAEEADAEFIRSMKNRIKLEDQQAKVAADAAKRDTGLRNTAGEANAASREYTSLARASTDLTSKVVSLRSAVDGIINPTAAARSNIGGLESEVQNLAQAIKSINGPVRDYQAQFKALADSSKELSRQASLVDDFKRQVEALRQSRAAFVAARAEVAKYATEVARGGQAGEAQVRALAQAETKLKSSANAMADQVRATRESRAALREAGIQTNGLAQAETRLADTARTATAATRQLESAVEQYGRASENTGKKNKLFNADGRESLSLFQRLRGEVLALAAAYVGLQGVANLALGSIQAVNNRESAKNQLSVAFPTFDRAQINEEYQYVRDQAERIGLVLEDSLKNYAKFAAGASLSGATKSDIRFIFESFGEVGTVMGLTADQMNGVFTALEQITSKGKIQAEELRGQLGERLPGAFQIAAKALRDQYPDLDKALEQGKVSSRDLIRIANEYRKLVAEQLPPATQSLIAEQNRLTNAVGDFKTAIADGGFADAYKRALIEITAFLKSEDGARFAKSLSDGFTAVAKTIVFLLQNIETLKTLLTAVIALWTANKLATLASDATNAAKALGGIGTELTKIQKALAVVQVAIAAFTLGTYLYNEFEEVRIAGANLVGFLDKYWLAIKAGVEILALEIPRFFKNAFANTVNAGTFFFRQLLGLVATAMRALGQGEAASGLEKAITNITLGVEEQSTKVAEVKEKLKKDLADIDKILKDTADFERNNKAGTSATRTTATTPFPGVTGGGETGLSDADLKKRENAIESIRSRLESLDAAIDRAEKKSLNAQLQAVDTQYAALERDIRALGGKQGADFLADLEKSKQDKKLQVVRDYNAKLAAEQESLDAKLEAADAAAGRKDKLSLDQRLQAIKDSYAATYRDIETFRQSLLDAGASDEPAQLQKERLDLAAREIAQLETKKFNTEELARLEARVNEQVALRQQLIATEEAQLAAGMQSEETTIANIERINNQMTPAIQNAAAAAITWATANREIFANEEAQTAFIAKMQAISATAGATNKAFTALQKTFVNLLTQGAGQALDKIGSSLAGLIDGTMTWGDALRAAGDAVLELFANILQGLAQQILQTAILRALGGTPLGPAAAAASVAVQHEGGMVGGVQNRTRTVSPALFANAPRYKTGGIQGLAPNEYAAILHKNEEVLNEGDPRNIRNGGLSPAPAPQRPQDIKIINAIDSASVVSEGLNTASGQRAILNYMKSNKAAVKAALG